MSKRRIFISYRRDEGAARATAIQLQLQQWQPDWEIFTDVSGIRGGDDWREKLSLELRNTDTVLVIIGPNWAKMTDAQGQRRLQDPHDITRWEVEQALAHPDSSRVIPVLIDGTRPPPQEDLPDSLRGLLAKQAIGINHTSFESDMEALLAAIEGETQRERSERERTEKLRERTRRKLLQLRLWSTPFLAALLGCLLWIGLLDLLSLDTRASIWSFALSELVAPSELAEEILLVAIPAEFDTHALAARQSYAALIDGLSAAGAERILLDLYFEDPRADDAALAAAMVTARARGTQLFFGFNELSNEEPQAVQVLAESADGIGLLCTGGRLDYVQVMPVVFNYDVTTQTLSPLPALALQGAYGPVSVYHLNREAMSLELRSGESTFRPAISLLDPIVKSHKACMPLRKGTQAALIFLRLSALDRMRSADHRVTMAEILSDKIPRQRIEGRIIIIGHESDDEEFQVAHRMQAQNRYGYELHADAINTLLSGRVARPLPLAEEFAVLLISAGIGGWLGVKLRDRSAWIRWSVLPAAVLLTLTGSVLSIALFDLIHQFAYSLFALLLSYTLFILTARRRLGRA